MREIFIDGIDFAQLDAEKYWSFSASYKGDAAAETKSMVLDKSYFGAEKKDGAYMRFIKGDNGEMSWQGRSRGVGGDYLNKIDWVPQLKRFFDSLPNGTCLLGEGYLPKKRGSRYVTAILGCLQPKAIERQSKESDRLHYYVFDVWAWGGKSLLNLTAEQRISYLEKLKNFKTDCIEIGNYLSGEALYRELNEILSRGGEGIVITKKNSKAEPGKRTARKTLKVKMSLAQTIDCFFTGKASAPTRLYTGKEKETWQYWQDSVSGIILEGNYYQESLRNSALVAVTRPYAKMWAGSLEIAVMKDNRVHPIGFLSGLSDEIKANFPLYKDKCIEVNAMEIFKDTEGLRHPKLVQFRDDLTPQDCTWEKIFG